MNKTIRDLLSDEIVSEFENLSSLELGSEEHTTAVDNLVKLYKLGIEETKVDWDYDEKCNRRVMECEQHNCELKHRDREEQLKRDQLAEQVKDRYFRLGVEAAGIILPLMFYAAWMKRGFKFEETGTYTSTTFRGLFNRFRPTKK